MTEPTIRFTDTGVTFPNGTQAVTGVSFEVRRGEFVALVGPSGCGKSTLLRLAAGLQAATAGEVHVRPGSVGYVFQDATLLPWRTVLRNVELPAELAGEPTRVRRTRARAAIERVGLAGFERHRPAQLSGGMRMRTSIARALTTRPELFLFDEPFGALDEITRDQLGEQLNALFTAEPFAGLFVTHSVPESVFLATRVIVLSGRPGRMVADIPVPFTYPRSPELRFDPEFAVVAAEVSRALRQAVTVAA